jgi:Ca2+-binding EF-hand superfamily protein
LPQFPSQPELQSMIDAVDSSGTNSVMFLEFLNLMQSNNDKSKAAAGTGSSSSSGVVVDAKSENKADHKSSSSGGTAEEGADEPLSSELIRQVFDSIDTDNDGEISIGELKLAFQDGKEEINDDEIAGIVLLADPNNERGNISFKAFATIMQAYEMN